jgi:radical SAM protein with 4Fe4S-binding SPASM domain
MRLHGGEITVIPKMKEFISFLGDNYPEMQINIVTNGVMFNEEWVELAKRYNIIVSMSVNSTSSETTKNILKHGNGEKLHEKIHKNLRLLVDAHDNNDKPLINVITIAVCEQTAKEIEPFAKLALGLGLNILYQFPCQMGAVISKNILDAVHVALKMKCYCDDYINIMLISSPLGEEHEDIIECIKNSANYNRDKDCFLSLTVPKKSKNKISVYEDNIEDKSKCSMPWKGLVIMSNGNIIPCANLSNYIMGNIYFDDIEDILYGDKRLNLQSMIENKCYKYCWKFCGNNFFPDTSEEGAYLAYIPPWKKAFEETEYQKIIDIIEKNNLNRNIENAELLYCYAFSLHATGEMQKAIEYYELSLKSGFAEFWVRYNRGSLLLDLGRLEEAREDLKRACELDPTHEGARQQLAATEGKSAAEKPTQERPVEVKHQSNILKRWADYWRGGGSHKQG